MAKTQLLKFTLASKNVLSLEETELYELTQLAGVVLDPNVFKIILDLLKLNVDPTAVFQMLTSMTGQRRKKGEQLEPRPSSRTQNTNSASSNKSKFVTKGRQPTGRQRPDNR